MKKRVASWFALVCCCAPAWSREFSAQAPKHETVILVHGLCRSTFSLKKLEWTLKCAGYDVINRSYPSTRLSVREAAENWLSPLVAAQSATDKGRRMHFVTHSLGGIVVRQYLKEHPSANLGRVVMLAPPNRGSELADRFGHHPLARLLGPTSKELGCGAASVPNALGPASFDVGIVAGDRSFDPWFSRFISGPDDGKVAVSRTAVEGMKDFLVVHRSHTWMMWSRQVNQAVVRFLEEGRFRNERAD